MILRKYLKNLQTPYYLYDADIIKKNINILKKNFSEFSRIFFAVKANTAIQILKIIKAEGLGAEVVSSGEIFICKRAGFSPKNIIYNNIARTRDEIDYAIKSGVRDFNFESLDQAILLDECARRLRTRIKLYVRINPGIFSKTHPHLSTGSSWSKFGIPLKDIDAVCRLIKKLRFAQFVGIHSHIGSQILSPAPFLKALKKVARALEYLEKKRIKVSSVNLGGGFGIPYDSDDRPLNLKVVSQAYKKFVKRHNIKLMLEPGRFVVGNGGYIITRIISIKKRNGMPLYIIDAGMTENPRPALYGAFHNIVPLNKSRRPKYQTRVAGPLCENSDEFGCYKLPKLKLGDLLMIKNCGAYTRTMASNYNGRLLPAEYLFDKRLIMIRKQQNFRTLIRDEKY